MSTPSGSTDIMIFTRAIESAAGIRISAVHRMRAGESGAWRLTARNGARYVLKTHPDPRRLDQMRRSRDMAQRLRDIDYPAPKHIAAGTIPEGAWELIAWLPGQSHQPVTARTLAQMISLNDRQRNAAPRRNPDWIAEIAASIQMGCDGFCRIDTLRNHASETSELLDHLQRIADDCRELESAGRDIVHFDYHPGNILIQDGSVSGVIDWSGAGVGDANFDLATLLFYCYDEHSHHARLTQAILDRAAPQALRLYLAHMILRQVDWSIRFHDDATASHFIERSRRILTDTAEQA